MAARGEQTEVAGVEEYNIPEAGNAKAGHRQTSGLLLQNEPTGFTVWI